MMMGRNKNITFEKVQEFIGRSQQIREEIKLQNAEMCELIEWDYWSDFFSIRVEHTRESRALRLINFIKNHEVVKQWLNLLLEKGIKDVLAYPYTEFLPSSDSNNNNKRTPVDHEQKANEQKIHDMLNQESEANALIRKLAKSLYYPAAVEIEQTPQIHEQLINEYGKSREMIYYEVENLRRKMAKS